MIALAIMYYFAKIWADIFLGLFNRNSGPNPQPLGVCGLYRRAIEIAREHGMEVKHIAILRNRQLRMANAWAYNSSGESAVILTEELVQNMTRDEADAVIAHELGHCVDQNCWEYRMISGYALAFFWLALMALVERWINTLPVGLHSLHYVKWASIFVVPGLVSAWYSRSREREADGNVGVLANPKAGIAAECKLSILNSTPLDRPWWSQALASHPPGRARIRAIMKQFNIAEAEGQEICQAAEEDLSHPSVDRYELIYGESPTADAGGEAIKGELLDRKGYNPTDISARMMLILLGGIAVASVLFYYGMVYDRYLRLLGPAALVALLSGVIMSLTWRRSRGNLRLAMTERLLVKYGAEPGQPYLLADVMFNEDFDEDAWQGAWLTTAEGELLVMGEVKERRINLQPEIGLYRHGDSSDNSVIVFGYRVDSVPQMLLIRVLGEPSKGEPRNIYRLEKVLRAMIAGAGGKLPEREKLGRRQLVRMPLALAGLSSAILFVHYTMKLTALDKLGVGFYPHVVCFVVLGPMLWGWAWRKDKKDGNETER